MPPPEQVFVVSSGETGLRLDLFLSRRIPRMSRSSVQDAIRDRVSLSSGAQPKASRQVFAGEVVTIRSRPVPASALERERPAILHEADGWMIVDKPAGLASTPNASRPGDDVATLTGLSPVHRLDRFTSGCLLLTWSAAAARHFERTFREHEVRKEYLAVVRGVPAFGTLVVDAPLESDVDSRIEARMRVAAEGHGTPARTELEMVASAPDGASALVRAIPLSGRRHQIRVHLAHAGHPVVGDLLYGGDERDFIRFQLGQRVETPAGLEPGRHLLHAASVEVIAPDGERVVVEAPLPGDFPAWARPARTFRTGG